MSPFRSKAQQKYMFWAEKEGKIKPGTARRWAHETKSIKSLPERVGSKKSKSKAKSKSRRKGRWFAASLPSSAK